LDVNIAHPSGASAGRIRRCESRERKADSKKNECKPWLKKMWCIGRITAEYRRRMYDLLELYALGYCKESPVICVDEKSKQLLAQTREPMPIRVGSCRKEDYEYKRCGTRNIFLAVEPRGKWRHVEILAYQNLWVSSGSGSLPRV